MRCCLTIFEDVAVAGVRFLIVGCMVSFKVSRRGARGGDDDCDGKNANSRNAANVPKVTWWAAGRRNCVERRERRKLSSQRTARVAVAETVGSRRLRLKPNEWKLESVGESLVWAQVVARRLRLTLLAVYGNVGAPALAGLSSKWRTMM